MGRAPGRSRLGASLVLAIAAGIAACRGSMAPGAPSAVTEPASPTSAPAVSNVPDAAAAEAPAPRVRRELAPGTELHAGPVALDDGTWVAWIGSGRTTRARLLLAAGGEPRPVSLEPLPPGVRAVEAFRQGRVAVALLESVALLDQPAGMRGVDVFPAGPPLDETDRVALSRAPSREAARAWLLQRRVEPPITEAEVRRLFALPVSPRMLAASGVRVLRSWQGLFAQEEPRRASASESGASWLLARLSTSCREASCCSGATCSLAAEEGGAMQLHVTREAGEPRIDAVVLDDEHAARLPAAAPREVARSASTAATVAALARLGLAGQVLAEAPLGVPAEGTVGVVRVNDDQGASVIAVEHEPELLRALTLPMHGWAPEPLEVAFADLDGDGRTDVVLGGRAAGPFVDPTRPRAPVFAAFLSPRAPSATDVVPDPAAGLAMARAPTLARALAAALAVPTGGLPRVDACAVLGALARPGTAASVLAPGAALFTYTEPSAFAVSARPGPLSAFVSPGGRFGPCEAFACDPSRPVCRFDNPPETDWFVMQRDRRGRLRIVAAAVYTGS